MHLPTWADRRQTFERIAAALRPGGRFAWNAFVFDPQIAVKLDGHCRKTRRSAIASTTRRRKHGST